MNRNLFEWSTTDLRVNYNFMGMILGLWYPNPQEYLANDNALQLTPDDRVYIQTNDSVQPHAAILQDDYHTLILLSGTNRQLHVPQLLNGWNNPNAAIFGSGVNPAFENAALQILSRLPADFLDPQGTLRIVGHSYGGACGQAMAEYLVSQRGFSRIQCISYGSPRPGNERFQERMTHVDNTRFYSSDDPVRFIPPHLNEIPSIIAFHGARLWQGMDSQVQTMTGWEVSPSGVISQREGNPSRLHAVITSIGKWIADFDGFRSELHSLENYRNRFLTAIQASFVIPPKQRVDNPEEPLEVNSRQRETFEKEATADINADPTINLRAGTEFTLERQAGTSRDRYKRKKQGSRWVVMFRGEVVAVGPGKRRAGSLARSMNRAAKASG